MLDLLAQPALFLARLWTYGLHLDQAAATVRRWWTGQPHPTMPMPLWELPPD